MVITINIKNMANFCVSAFSVLPASCLFCDLFGDHVLRGEVDRAVDWKMPRLNELNSIKPTLKYAGDEIKNKLLILKIYENDNTANIKNI